MSRNTHHRQRDHNGYDLDTNILIDGAIGGYPDQTPLHTVLSGSVLNSGALEIVIGHGLQTIDTGFKGDVEMPFSGEFTAYRMLADVSGSVVVDIWKKAYSSLPPTDSDTITGGNEATITSGIKSEDVTLTGWTTSFSAGDWLRFYVDSASTVKQVTLSLRYTLV